MKDKNKKDSFSFLSERKIEMQAIQVKFYWDRNGNSKFIAKCQAGKMIDYQSSLEAIVSLRKEQGEDISQDMSIHAAICCERLMTKLGWTNEIAGYGQLSDNSFVFTLKGDDDSKVLRNIKPVK